MQTFAITGSISYQLRISKHGQLHCSISFAGRDVGGARCPKASYLTLPCVHTVHRLPFPQTGRTACVSAHDLHVAGDTVFCKACKRLVRRPAARAKTPEDPMIGYYVKILRHLTHIHTSIFRVKRSDSRLSYTDWSKAIRVGCMQVFPSYYNRCNRLRNCLVDRDMPLSGRLHEW